MPSKRRRSSFREPDCPGTARRRAQLLPAWSRKCRAEAGERAQGASGSFDSRRNFCLQLPPCRHRQGLEELADEVPSPDIVACRKVAVVALPARERAEAGVVFVAAHFPGAIERQLRRVPGIDTADADAVPVRHVLHHLLHGVGVPEVEPLRQPAVLLPLEVQVLEDDDMRPEIQGCLDDEPCCLYCHSPVLSVDASPEVRHPLRAVALCSANEVAASAQAVVFIRELEESPPADRAARVDGAAHCRAVDAEVYAKRNPIFYGRCVDFSPLLEREVEIPVFSASAERRASFLAVDAMLADIGGIALSERNRHPVPGATHPGFEFCCLLGKAEEAVATVHGREGTPDRRRLRLPVLLCRCFPVGEVALVRLHHAEGFHDDRTPQIRRKLRKLFVEIVLRQGVAPCPMRQGFNCLLANGIVTQTLLRHWVSMNGGDAFPFLEAYVQEEEERRLICFGCVR